MATDDEPRDEQAEGAEHADGRRIGDPERGPRDLTGRSPKARAWRTFLVTSAIAILIGYAFHHLVDTPLQQAARRFGQSYFGAPKAKLAPAWPAAASDPSDRLR